MPIVRLWKEALVVGAFGIALMALVSARRAREASERTDARSLALAERLRDALATIDARDSAVGVAELELRKARAREAAAAAPASPDSFVVALAGDVELPTATPVVFAPTPEGVAIPPMRGPTVAVIPETARESAIDHAPRTPALTSLLFLPRQRRLDGAARVFALAFAAGDGLNAWLHFDRDVGGYVDSWHTADKLAHGAMGAVIAQSALNAGVPRRWAAPITCAGAVGFEYSQGFVSWKDALAGCSGAVAATIIDKVAEGLRR